MELVTVYPDYVMGSINDLDSLLDSISEVYYKEAQIFGISDELIDRMREAMEPYVKMKRDLILLSVPVYKLIGVKSGEGLNGHIISSNMVDNSSSV